MPLENENLETNENQTIDTIPLAQSIAGAKILGIAQNGDTNLFDINKMLTGYKGKAVASTVPGTAVAGNEYEATPGITYANFRNIANQPISIPSEVDGKQILSAKLRALDATHWEAVYTPVEIDLVNYAKVSDIKGTAKFLEPAGNNHFNKEDVIDGYYVEYSSGNLFPLGVSNVARIKVKPLFYYKIQQSQQYAFFDENDTYITGNPNTGQYGIIQAPENASYFLINVFDEFLDIQNINESLAANQGIEQLPYEPFRPSSQKVFVPSSNIVTKNVVTIGKNSNYRTINAALDGINDDTETNEYVFVINPGIYIESINLVGRYVTLQGVDKETCIIKTFTNDYYHPPIDMACNNHLYNLTIIADQNETTPIGGVNGLKAYGIHFDVAGRFEAMLTRVQGRSIVKNCRVISMNTHAIALGLWTNQYLEFDDVEMYSPTTAAFRAHNYLPAGATNQKMMVRNCRIHNLGNIKPIVLQDANQAGSGGKENRDTVFTFQNTVAWNDNGQLDVVDLSYLGPQISNGLSGFIKLGVASFGNNSSLLNFPNGI